eukprot:1719106-Prymnesium_polylepis.1
MAGTTSAAEPTVATEPCTQVINVRYQDRPAGGAAFGGRRSDRVRAPQPTRTPIAYPLTSSSDVRRTA